MSIKTDLIAKINTLKTQIDQCLDNRDREEFFRLSYELKVCQRYLGSLMNKQENTLFQRLEKNRDKFFHL